MQKYCKICGKVTEHIEYKRKGNINDYFYLRCKGLRKGKRCNNVIQIEIRK